MTTACSTPPTYFDESKLKVDSILVKNDAGETLSRTIYYYDPEDRDTMMTVDNSQGRAVRKTKFNEAGLVMSECIISPAGTAATEFTRDSLGHATEQTETFCSHKASSQWRTTLATDSEGRITQSIRTDSIGNQTKITIARDSLGNETESTTYNKVAGADNWTPERRYTHTYAALSDTTTAETAAAFYIWEDENWHELSSEKYTYDAIGREVEKVETADEIKVITRITYDEAGNIIFSEATTYDASEGDNPTDAKRVETKYSGNIKIEREYSLLPNGGLDPLSTTTITYCSPRQTHTEQE